MSTRKSSLIIFIDDTTKKRLRKMSIDTKHPMSVLVRAAVEEMLQEHEACCPIDKELPW